MKRKLLIVAVVAVTTTGSAHAQWTPIPNHEAIDVSSGGMEALFGPEVASLNVAVDRPLFSFTGSLNHFDDANVITKVFQADAAVNLGGITLNVGDYTFAYLIDFPNNPFNADGSLDDFQLNAVVTDFGNPNPNELIALAEIKGAGYSSNVEFAATNANYLQSYPEEAATQSVLNMANGVQYDWPVNHPDWPGAPWEQSGFLQPGDKNLVFLFTTPNINILEIGEGANPDGGVFQGSDTVEYIPVLVPVVPEPGTSMLLVIGAVALLARRRGRRFI